MNTSLFTGPTTPFNPDDLRSGLPEFDFAAPMPRDALFQAYRSYYHLNFEKRMPGLKVTAGKTSVGGFDIAIQVFMPATALGSVFLVHGYYDHVGIFDHVIETLLQQGFNVVAFDLPGHGLSSGPRGTIFSFLQYQIVLQKIINLAQGKLPEPWHFVVQSTGAAIVSEYLLGNAALPERQEFSSAVLMAPLVRPVNWRLNSAMHSIMAPWRDYIPRKFVNSSNDPSYLQFARYEDPLQPHYLSAKWVGALKQWIPLIERHQPMDFPVLLVQGRDDRTVDWRHNIPVLQQKFPASELMLVPAMRHQVVNEAPGFRALVFDRMNHFLVEHNRY